MTEYRLDAPSHDDDDRAVVFGLDCARAEWLALDKPATVRELETARRRRDHGPITLREKLGVPDSKPEFEGLRALIENLESEVGDE